MEDQLTDFERAEHYKQLYEQTSKSRTLAIIIFSVVCLVLGYLLARFMYLHHFNFSL